MRDSGYALLKIRPHHGLCSEFFRGMGYSAEFTENMKKVLERLGTDASEIVPTVGADVICARCPHNKDGVCETSEKVTRYDNAVLDLCELSEGEAIMWEDFKKLVREKIISAGRLSQVCGDCSWYEFCVSEASKK